MCSVTRRGRRRRRCSRSSSLLLVARRGTRERLVTVSWSIHAVHVRAGRRRDEFVGGWSERASSRRRRRRGAQPSRVVHTLDDLATGTGSECRTSRIALDERDGGWKGRRGLVIAIAHYKSICIPRLHRHASAPPQRCPTALSDGCNSTTESQPALSMPPDRTHHPAQQHQHQHSTAQRFSDAINTGMPMSSVGPTHPPSLERGRACLTCRRRRVKCDGARPVCGRCSKSARAHGESVATTASFPLAARG